MSFSLNTLTTYNIISIYARKPSEITFSSSSSLSDPCGEFFGNYYFYKYVFKDFTRFHIYI